MHWHIYLVLAVAGACVVILDLALGRCARAGALSLLVASIALAAWNGREEERKTRAVEREARDPDAPHE
nr:hypothetical protein [uncultured Pseudoxanthomonas sp.]